MARWVRTLLFAGCLAGAAAGQQKKNPPRQQEQEPPEEDENVKEKVYGFNPLQSSKELQVGNYYWKKGSYRAAMMRFREATRWNAGNADAWLRLAEAHEKLKDPKSAKEAYARYLELSPDAKNAARIRKKLK